MTNFWLIRHGPTHAKGMVGWSDLPADLSDHAALARLSAALPDKAVVISSDLSRASATADAIQGKRHRLPHDPRLREFHFGDWEGKTFAQIEASHPDLARAYYETPGDVRPPGGESWHDLSARISPVLDELATTHSGGDVVVVAHFGVILTQLQRALYVSPYDVLAHRIDNLSLTRITHADPWQVHAINHRP